MVATRLTHMLRAAALAAGCTAAANAAVIESDVAGSTEGLGQFSGSLDYFATAPGLGTLTVTLTNTSDPDNGGFITGFVFNIDSADPSATATLTSASHPFAGVTSHAAPPFGQSFTAGAALGANWTGGGNPNAGIAVGGTGAFTFDVAASDAASLTAASFMSGPYDFNFVVRFRGFDDGGSDKVPGTIIPGPASIMVIAVALLVGRTRRR